MDPRAVRSFTERFLQCHECQIIESAPSHIITQLSIQADKDLLNRPMYWMYVEKMNLPPNPSQLCFIFNPEERPPELRGEYLFHGSPRFTHMLQSAQKLGRFVRLYQQPAGDDRYTYVSKAYTQWLGVNFKVSYVCDQKKDQVRYLGVNMENGEIVEGFYQAIQGWEWSGKLPAQRHTVKTQLSLAQALGELEYYLQDEIEKEDLSWAEQAMDRLRAEMVQLEQFYPETMSDELAKEKKQRQSETIWQYHPRVEVSVINAGLFHMEGVLRGKSFRQ